MGFFFWCDDCSGCSLLKPQIGGDFNRTTSVNPAPDNDIQKNNNPHLSSYVMRSQPQTEVLFGHEKVSNCSMESNEPLDRPLPCRSTAENGMMYEHASRRPLATASRGVLTCRLGSEFVPVGGAHGQQPVAQVQVEALLSSHTAHHLQEEIDGQR